MNFGPLENYVYLTSNWISIFGDRQQMDGKSVYCFNACGLQKQNAIYQKRFTKKALLKKKHLFNEIRQVALLMLITICFFFYI